MRTGIEQARLDLAKWEARMKDDRAGLAVAERDAAAMRDRLATSERAVASLRGCVQRWDALHASHETPNAVVTG